jgi:hypothetical protein
MRALIIDDAVELCWAKSRDVFLDLAVALAAVAGFLLWLELL